MGHCFKLFGIQILEVIHAPEFSCQEGRRQPNPRSLITALLALYQVQAIPHYLVPDGNLWQHLRMELKAEYEF